MKIILFERLGVALLSEEATHTFINDKIPLSIVDGDGSAVPATMLVCGNRIKTGGIRDSIPSGAIREGTHPVSVVYEGKTYHVGAFHREKNKLKAVSVDQYRTIVETIIVAEKAFKLSTDLINRVSKLEESAYGVDILNLNSEV